MEGGVNRTFVPSPVDNWRKFLRNMSFSNKAETFYNTFIPLYVDQNVSEIPDRETPGIDSDIVEKEEGLNMVKENNDDVGNSNTTQGSDSFSVESTRQTPALDSDNDIGGKSSNDVQEEADKNSSKKARYPGVDVSEDVFYLLEK